MRTFPLLLICCALVHYCAPKKHHYNSAAAASILQPLNQLQIVIRISDCSTGSKTAAPVSQSVDHFRLHNVPSQLYCGPNDKYKRPHYQAARTVENRLAWIVFQRVSHPFSRISLYHLLMVCCVAWVEMIRSEPVRKDLFVLITDITRAVNWPIRNGYVCNITRCYVPFFLIIFRWQSNPDGTSAVTSPAVWAVESCYFLKMYTIPLDDYFATVAGKGINRLLVEDIKGAHKDFHGEVLAIYPNVRERHSLEKWQRILAWLTFRKGHNNRIFALANLLAITARQHNFTFHTLRKAEQHTYCMEGMFSMETDTGGCYGQSTECFAPSVSLLKYTHWKIMHISEPSWPHPAALCNIREPLTAAWSCALLAVTLAVTIVFMSGRKSRAVSSNLLLVSAAFFLQVAIPGRLSRKMLAWYACWLLLAWHLSSLYTTVLQSSSIVPGLRDNRMTLEEMLEQNFSFVTLPSNLALIKRRYSSDRVKEYHVMGLIEKERMLADRVCPIFFEKLSGYAGTSPLSVLNIEKKKVMLTRNLPMQLFVEIARTEKKNLVFGVEKLFHAPAWWNFDSVEKGELLRGTVERVKASGLEEYFLNLYVSHEFRFQGDEATVEEPPFLVGGLLTEGFVLFIYGAALSAAQFALKLMVDYVMHGAFRAHVSYLKNLCT